MEDKDEKYRLYGILGTIFFHAAVIAILCFCVMTAEVIEEEALLIEPTAAGSSGSSGGAPAQSQPEPQPQPQPEPVQPTPSQPANVADGQVKDTQDFEEAAALAEAKRKADEQAKKEKEIAEKKAKEDALKKQQEQEQKEAVQRARDEKIKAQKEQKATANMNVNNAFAKKGTGDNDNGSSNGTGQGNSTGSGSGNGSGRGTGNGNGVIGGGLEGRGVEYQPRLEQKTQEEGYVVVEVKVNRDGQVVEATIRTKGTTLPYQSLHNAAIENAKKVKFVRDLTSASTLQVGTITYHFKVQ